MADRTIWHNQACARCGVTAELHGSCKIGGTGPMQPRCECATFVWGEEEFFAADRIATIRAEIAKQEKAYEEVVR